MQFSGDAKFKSLVLRGKSGGTRYTIPVSALPIDVASRYRDLQMICNITDLFSVYTLAIIF